MHHLLEIVMPQVDDVEKTVGQIMNPFNENSSYDKDEDFSGHPFWDWYVIGGRWAGHKLTAGLDEGKVEAFYAELKEKKVTVSGLQCGKQEIAPADQIPMVDEIWATFFPEYKGRACPLFMHSNNQYANDCLYGDVLRIKDLPDGVTCSHLIVANLGYTEDKYEAISMFQTGVWNGVNHEDTAWDGSISAGLELHRKKIENCAPEYRDRNTPTEDWIVVTVDYHS